ncbi:SDR family NAD(P)-dependent oxidoreductase [Pseudovibrio sp. JE062]|uniref:SDR family NAD(P)-dependent oxidoreductase n=1 Tax=Pseudovibrio sp. JE062 TaxID=439495 RepID=UPI000186C418|nr:SDR family NAD(P)-dependent oxidoreductase [Pseudovibrio sp. JE062]EEA94634.1 3-oxoacyl-(acyl-carrier-protein) reductase [Pseudovibrio sp. JE062]
MSVNYDYKGKLVVVTGGARGLGFAMAQRLINSNAKVVITDLQEESLKSACEQLGENASHRVHNVTAYDSTPALVDDIEAKEGPIFGLVNNAGVHLKKPIWDVTDEEWLNVVNINQNGLFVMTREVLRYMRPRKDGSIVNVSSMGGLLALPTAPAYVTTKTAVIGLTRNLAVDLGPENIRVNAICPGFIDTEMTRAVLDGDPVRGAKIKGRIPMPRLAQPEEIAAMVAFLCSEDAAYVNGQSIAVDGGFSVGF